MCRNQVFSDLEIPEDLNKIKKKKNKKIKKNPEQLFADIGK